MNKGAAIITGGSRRIGRAMALQLAAHGYDIALHYHHSAQEAEQLAKDIRALGRQCLALQADLAGFQCLEPLIRESFKAFPHCNLLINNASSFERGHFLETTEEAFDNHMDVNFKAPFFLTQAFAKYCKAGQVINMIDTYVSKNRTPYFSYLLSKKALYALTEMTALELGPHIRVNGINPGITELSHEVAPALLNKKIASLPLRSIVKIEDIVAAVLQLTEAPYLTGQVICVDGGEHLL